MSDITTGSKTVKLSSVESMESFERVTVNVKVTDVKDKRLEEEDELWVINNATVVGVPYFDSYKSCFQCKARVEPNSDRLGKCSQPDCQMTQRLDLCPPHTTAKLMLMYEDEGVHKTVFAFAYGETVQEMVVMMCPLKCLPNLELSSRRLW